MQAHPLLTRFHYVMIVLIILVTILGFFLVPLDQQLPIHWNIRGEADGFAPAPFALLLPLALVAFIAAVMLILRRAQLQKDFESGRFVINATLNGLTGLALMLLCTTILIGRGHQLDMLRLVMMAVSILLVMVGNVLPKSQQNWVAGIRLPWTLRDTENWQLTHRWAGWVMVILGLIAFGIAVVSKSHSLIIGAVLMAALLPILVAFFVSYSHAVKRSGQ